MVGSHLHLKTSHHLLLHMNVDFRSESSVQTDDSLQSPYCSSQYTVGHSLTGRESEYSKRDMIFPCIYVSVIRREAAVWNGCG